MEPLALTKKMASIVSALRDGPEMFATKMLMNVRPTKVCAVTEFASIQTVLTIASASPDSPGTIAITNMTSAFQRPAKIMQLAPI